MVPFRGLVFRGQPRPRLRGPGPQRSALQFWGFRSASRRLLVVPRHRLSTYGRRAFAVAGPMAWNSFPDNLQDLDLTTDNFKRLLKTFLFSAYQCN